MLCQFSHCRYLLNGKIWQVKLSLLDSKENSVQCSEDSLARQRSRLLLAAKFLTKRLINIESVARTFKPLWRTQREIKIKDMREILMFSNLRVNAILNEYWNTNLGHMISIWWSSRGCWRMSPSQPYLSSSLPFGSRFMTFQCTTWI